MTLPDFKPSQIELGVPPLVGTMGSAEAEHAAFLIVRACQFHGDVWYAQGPGSIHKVYKEDCTANVQPMEALTRNPFFNPLFGALVERGFARFLDDSQGAPIEFTDRGFKALEKWVRR